MICNSCDFKVAQLPALRFIFSDDWYFTDEKITQHNKAVK